MFHLSAESAVSKGQRGGCNRLEKLARASAAATQAVDSAEFRFESGTCLNGIAIHADTNDHAA